MKNSFAFEIRILLMFGFIFRSFSVPATTARNNESTTSTFTSTTTQEPAPTAFNIFGCQKGIIDFGSSHAYSCKCWENWEGQYCELAICGNGAARTEEKTCECVDDWVGEFCDKKLCDEYRLYSKDQAKCVCKKSKHEGERCQIPQCDKDHGTLKIDSDGNGFCECESELWYGNFCNENKCGRHGTPYFEEIVDEKNEARKVARCKCDKGFQGTTSCAKDCHGHGSTFFMGLDLGFCNCDEGWSMSYDCATCSYGYSGSNCKRAQIDYKTSYNTNGNNDDGPGSSDNSYSTKSTPGGSIAAILVVVVIGSIISIVCKCMMRGACRDSSGLQTTVVHGQGIYGNPVPITAAPYPARDPNFGQAYGSHNSPTGYDYLPYSSTASYQDPSVVHRNGTDTTFVAPSVTFLNDGVHEVPPPSYAEAGIAEDSQHLDEHLPPPAYEDAVKMSI